VVATASLARWFERASPGDPDGDTAFDEGRFASLWIGHLQAPACARDGSRMVHMSALRLLVVDDHAIVREGLVRVLTGANADWVVVQAGSGFQALALLREQRFDMVIADLSMPGMSGLDLIKRIRIEVGALPVLVLSMHAEEQYALRAFKAGANGYLTKERAGAELVAAVHKIVAGGAYASERLSQQVLIGLQGGARGGAFGGQEALTDREFDVLGRIVAGQSLSAIADALHLSVKTISSHKRRIMDRLQLSSTAALIRYGMEQGIHADGAPSLVPVHGDDA
jgi:DNA-binding NarL/FixJ family response regulator